VSAQLVTLLAALIAAIAAMGSLLVNVLVAGHRERRDVHRKAVETELPDLARTTSRSLLVLSSSR